MSITLFSSLPQRKKPYCSIKILLNQQIITMEEARLLYWYGDLSMKIRTLYPRYTSGLLLMATARIVRLTYLTKRNDFIKRFIRPYKNAKDIYYWSA